MLNREELNALFSSPALADNHSIGIAGGEPTISPFSWRLLQQIPENRDITITTNALKSGKLIDYLERQSCKDRFLIQVSIDGNEEVNDQVRGVPGGYKKSVYLLEQLKRLNVRTLVSFTVNRKNFHQILDIYHLAEQFQAQFSTRMAYCGGAYDNEENRALFEFQEDELETLEKSMIVLVNQALDQPGHHPAQLVFQDRMVSCYRDRREQRKVPCLAMETGMVVDLYGEVFPNCPVMMEKKLGNLRDKSLDEILNSIQALELKDYIRKFKCGGCWNDCQVVTNIARCPEYLFREYNRIKMRKIQILGNIPARIDPAEENNPFLLSGWHQPETSDTFGYCWTESDFAVPVPSGTRAIEMTVSLPEAKLGSFGTEILFSVEGMQKVAVSVIKPGWQTICANFKDCTVRAGVCTVSTGRAFCPGELGESSDFRRLGMAVREIRFLG